MTQHGADGLSQGDFSGGGLSGQNMLAFVPLHQSALERAEPLLSWIREQTCQPTLSPLKPEEWFLKEATGKLKGIKMLMECGYQESPVKVGYFGPHPRLWQTQQNHVFICPCLMTVLGRKMLQKVCDIVFKVPAEAQTFWPSSAHEPLIVGLAFCFLPHNPWQIKFTTEALGMDGKFHDLWKDKGGNERAVLCKLCISQRVFCCSLLLRLSVPHAAACSSQPAPYVVSIPRGWYCTQWVGCDVGCGLLVVGPTYIRIYLAQQKNQNYPVYHSEYHKLIT